MDLSRVGTSLSLALALLSPVAGAQSTSRSGAHAPAQLVPAGAARETLFVGDTASGEVRVFTVDPGGGLAQVAGSPFQAGTTPYELALWVPGTGGN